MSTAEHSLRSDLAWGLLLGVWMGLASLAPTAPRSLWVALPVVLIPLAWWVLSGANRWIGAFLAAALLLPPLPLPWGDAGVHPALVPAALGLWAGLARLRDWQVHWNLLTAALSIFLFALLLSVPLAAWYSGTQVAAGSLARVGLFAISVYLFFYVAHGPGRGSSPQRLIRLLFWTGFCSAAFACLDFYFQFPAPSRFAEQFVWLPNGVFRRAQGVFYEASTLGSLCVFLLVMMASIVALRLGGSLRLSRLWLLAGGIVVLAALLLSFSRAAMISLGVALLALAWLERHRLRIAFRPAGWTVAVSTCLVSGSALVYWFFPGFLAAYFERFWYSLEYLLSAPNLILSRRLESWGFLLDYLRENPWHSVFGIGYKTLPYSEFLGRPIVADNMYLSLLIETGWLGFSGLLLLNVAVLVTTYRLATSSGSGGSGLRRLFGVWMFCFWCGQIVQMMTGDVLTYWRILPAFFAVLGVGVRGEDPLS